MIYLLGQMSFILLLAAIAGAALGWGFHRLRNQQHVGELHRVISQQQQQVKQAETDVAMLAQDYDELKQTSRTTIDNLRNENAQIPNLHQNLDKSQLLVRQLMQKHEAQIRAYATENDALKSKLKNVDDREHALNKLQSDVERGRREINNAQADSAAADNSIKENDSATSTAGIAASSEIGENAKTEPVTESGSAVASGAEPTTGSETDVTLTAVSAERSSAEKTKAKAETDTPALDLSDDVERAKARATSERKTRQTIAELTEKARAKIARERAEAEAADARESDTDALDMSTDVSGEAGSLTIALAEADVVLAAIDKKREEELLVEDDEVIDASEFDIADDEDEGELLFDPVDQHDDLQAIFGIGPVTERGLNKLGITSYSQLAELKRHDIEKIAGALEIVPGKIERENWVGNARRQLEDVLEEL